MNIHRTACVIVVSLYTHVSSGQDTLRNTSLSFRAGVGVLYMKDEFQSPYTYSGTNPLIGLTGVMNRSRGSHNLDLSFSWGKIQSIVSPKANTATLSVHYDYLVQLTNPDKQKRLVFSAGLGLHSVTNRSTYLPNIELPVYSISSTAFMSASAQVHYALNKKSQLMAQASLPIAGIVYRPDFEVDGKSLLKFTSPTSSQLFYFKATYAHRLRPRLHFIATYDYSYFSTDEPRSLTFLNQGLTIGLRKTF
ncbi:MAG TPA: hypothetical protein VIU12_17010 [Chryseolinea sp.]